MRNVSLAVITNTKGECLLQLRDAGAPTSPNAWSLFGGHQEGSETPLETLIRELKEEISLSLAPGRFTHLDTVPYPNALISLFRVSLTDEEEKDIRLKEGAAFRFFASGKETLGLEMPPQVRALFQKYF
ncbi:MAG: NUDIX domain-containing protein [bacterium]|nr:NUDIX domain-containing protein [bacterium]